MIKDCKEFTEVEQILMIMDGTSFAMYEANLDKENYENFKKGVTKDIDKDTLKDMKILNLLERLGYPMNEIGTYFFKDVISDAYDSIQDVHGRRDMDKCRNLLSQLTDTFSDFYRYIATDWKEIGITSFHLYIQKSLEQIDNNKVDKELSKRIYGNNSEDNNYGLHAFQIAAYALDKYSFNDTKEYKQPKVRNLDNTPKNFKLTGII